MTTTNPYTCNHCGHTYCVPSLARDCEQHHQERQ